MGNEYLAHHGVKGQKWGVRRYQNDDGTLTALGKQRYRGQTVYKSTFARKMLAPELRDKYSVSKFAEGLAGSRARRLREKANATGSETLEKKATRAEGTYEAYKAKNANMKAYAQRTSTGKLFVQNAAFSVRAGSYRNARAAGKSQIESLLAQPLLIDKDAYGRYIIWQD